MSRITKQWLSQFIAILSCCVSTHVKAGSCVWTPPGGDSIPVGANITISAEPGDPAPDIEEKCGCNGSQTVNWKATGGYTVTPPTGDVSGGQLDTYSPGTKTVSVNISYKYKCEATGAEKSVDDVGNPWTKTYTVSDYYIDGESDAGQNEQVPLEVKAASGGTVPNVTGWDTPGGTQTGLGASIQVSWSTYGKKTVTATIENYGTVTKTVEVRGNLDVSIASPSDPAVVKKDEATTFTANEPTNGAGNYTYEWDFGSGTAPAGAKFQKVATGVQFGQQVEGNKTTVTLTVRDGSGNSGTASVIVTVPSITLSKESTTYYMSSTVFPNHTTVQSTTNNNIKLKATVCPADAPVSVVFAIDHCDPANNQGPKGSFLENSDGNATNEGGGIYTITFEPRTETSSNKCSDDDVLKSIALYFKGDVKSSTGVILNTKQIGAFIQSKFNTLIFSGMKNECVNYVADKYSLSRYSVQFGNIASNEYANTSLSGIISVGDRALTAGEQWVHSVIIHEGTHVDQGFWLRAAYIVDFDGWVATGGLLIAPGDTWGGSTFGFGCTFSSLELEAWSNQLDAAVTCISAVDLEEISERIDYYLWIHSATWCSTE